MKDILVVDDSEMVRKFFSYVLGHAGYRVEVAEDGQIALDRFYRGGFDLVITDVNMPRLDGFGLIREIRAHGAYDTLPIIILSTEDGVDDRADGLGLGANLYLVKPSEPEHLVDCVRRVLEA